MIDREVEPQRLPYGEVLPGATRALSGVERVVDESGLEPKLRELVKTRASQLNGCTFCLDMHTKDAIAIGEDPRRLHSVAAWRETPGYTDRERAALAWTEAITLLHESGAPREVYEWVASVFSPTEQVALTLAIVAINSWNRMAVAFRSTAGQYVSHRHPAEEAAPAGVA